MTKIRKFFYYLAGFVAFLCLMQLPFAFAISSVFSSPDHIDTALKEGGVYDNAVSVALDEATKKLDEDKQNNDPNQKQSKDPLTDSGVREAITSSVQPNDIQYASRTAIDGIFAWLQGKTEQPEFMIDLSGPANKAVENLGVYTQNRAASLPVCTIEQLRTIDQEDPLNLPCLPPGVSATQVKQQVVDQVKQNVDFIKEPVIDSKKLIKEEDRKKLQESQAPQAYQALHASKWLTLGVTVILVFLLILARRDRLAGIRYVGILMLVAAGLLGLVLVASQVGKSNIPVGTDKIAEIATKSIINLFTQIMAVVRWFVLGYAVLGIAGLVAVHKMKPTNPTEIPHNPHSADNPITVS